MKCYLALTEPDSDNEVYIDLLEVTLKSANSNTSLVLYALYDGNIESPCYKLLKKYKVNIISHKFSHEQYLPKIYPLSYLEKKFGKVIPYRKIAGTFMRLDIPFIEKDEDYVLYCDIDVMFNKDIRLDELPLPRYLAAAPEFDKDITKMNAFNAGVLLLNVQNMKEKISQIFSLLQKGKPNATGVFDQGFLNQFCFKDMDLLPIEYNWKPYWGINKEAKIIHFHGMKPNGNMRNSGFSMNPYIFFHMLKGHESDFDGLVYYSLCFFQTLGKDGKNWISSYLTNVFLTYLHYSLNKQSDRVVTYQECKDTLKLFLKRKLEELRD